MRTRLYGSVLIHPGLVRSHVDNQSDCMNHRADVGNHRRFWSLGGSEVDAITDSFLYFRLRLRNLFGWKSLYDAVQLIDCFESFHLLFETAQSDVCCVCC